MRARVLLAVLVAGLVAAPAALASGRNPEVAGLQVALREQGLYRGPIDGIDGPRTVAALRAFQRSHGLPVTGTAGLRTRTALGPLGRPLFGTRVLRRGDFGWDVAVLQFLLVRHGIAVPVNAYFDGPTLRGVRELQRRLHLVADGVVGPLTRRALTQSAHIPTRTHVSGHHADRSKLGTQIHVVRPGESLWILAHRFHTTIARLARLNHLDPAKALLVGTRLRVPAQPRRVKTEPTAFRVESVSTVRALLDRWAAHYGVNAHLVRALAWMESGYNNRLVSSTGARGIMQVEPYTWRFVEQVLLHRRVRHDASGNVRVGVAYLHHLLVDFQGNERLALAAWYQGERAVRRVGVYAQTKPFVADVLALQRRM